ncbi:MAG: Rossmann fold nucleotide-binding protein, partial [Nocardioides sp.]
RLAGASAGTLTDALAQLATVPHYHPSVDAWAASAREVLQGLEPDLGATTEVLGTETLGIPTWHYGHEPPNLFASAIAKMFTNALRESVLLLLCDAGVVVLPGAAGTVQEIFTDACENYYADPGTVAPLVLVGRRHWTEELPAWGLLTSLAQGRPMAEHIHLVDSPEEAAEILLRPA